SFLMSVPSVAGAGIKELYDNRHAFTELHGLMTNTIIATVISFIVGYACIAWLLKWIAKNGTVVFVIYRVILGIVLLVLLSKGSIDAV
ncbi:undecaprenyl-diphosphate phosphatase, partial [Acinetobacter baumannii]